MKSYQIQAIHPKNSAVVAKGATQKLAFVAKVANQTNLAVVAKGATQTLKEIH
jgi:hypothetical protein